MAILTTLLVSAWIFHFIYPLCYSIAVHKTKYSQKHIVQSGKAKEAYTTLAVSLSDFAKAYDREDKELYIDGKMYEVINLHTLGDTVYCSAMYDDKETKLHHGYSFEQKHNTSKGNSLPLSFWCTVNYTPSAYGQLTIFTAALNQPLFKAHHSFLSSGYTSRLSKPPETVIV